MKLKVSFDVVTAPHSCTDACSLCALKSVCYEYSCDNFCGDFHQYLKITGVKPKKASKLAKAKEKI